MEPMNDTGEKDASSAEIYPEGLILSSCLFMADGNRSEKPTNSPRVQEV